MLERRGAVFSTCLGDRLVGFLQLVEERYVFRGGIAASRGGGAAGARR